jgi:glycosyltransferase involved in cell wall biosynthesis
MTRIAFFLPDLAGGGAERVCVNLADGFVARGLDVDFVLAKAEGPLLKALPAGVKVVDLSVNRTLAAVLPLASYLRRERPYALIAAPDHANLVAIWAKLFGRSATRVVITHHNHPSLAIRNSPKLQEKMYPLLMRIFHRWAFGLVAVSHGLADDLSRLTGILRAEISVIHNPVVSDVLEKLKTAPVDHPWFETGMPPVVLAVGRLTGQKDYSTLLKAFASLRGRRPLKLIILGEGEERPRLQSLIQELGIRKDVDMPGFVGNPYAFMTRSGVFVLSSAWEGFGNVLVEALACGTQVVSTDCPSGPSEILENGKYGRLVPVGDVPSLAKAIEESLDQPMEIEILKSRAAVFSVDTAVEDYLKLMGLK